MPYPARAMCTQAQLPQGSDAAPAPAPAQEHEPATREDLKRLLCMLHTNKRGRATQRVQQLRDQFKAAGFSLTASSDMSVRKVEVALQQWSVDDQVLAPLLQQLQVCNMAQYLEFWIMLMS